MGIFPAPDRRSHGCKQQQTRHRRFSCHAGSRYGGALKWSAAQLDSSQLHARDLDITSPISANDPAPRGGVPRQQLGIAYRRIPLLSIGEDVVVDSSLIIAVLQDAFGGRVRWPTSEPLSRWSRGTPPAIGSHGSTATASPRETSTSRG
ncbi:unnamed protein product [Diplocarpon coronariae]